MHVLQVTQFINAPTSVVRILGAAAPQTAAFFINYLLLLGLASKPIVFLRIPGTHTPFPLWRTQPQRVTYLPKDENSHACFRVKSNWCAAWPPSISANPPSILANPHTFLSLGVS